VIAQLAPDEPRSAEFACGTQAWKTDYPWLHHALAEIGPGARTASDSWRVKIQEELKTTLDFKIRPDGTAAVWCGLSGYDFHHDPTPKELFEGLSVAYRLECNRVNGANPWKMSGEAQHASPHRSRLQPLVRVSQLPVSESLSRAWAAVFLTHAETLVLIFLDVLALTLALSTVAVAVR
jgi:hypothetical protein